MVFKKLMMIFTLFAGCVAGGVFAQEGTANVKDSDVPIPPNKISIYAMPAQTPSVEIDDPYTSYTQKKGPRMPKDWIFFDVMFTTNRSAKQAWPLWLEDIEVTIEVFIPGLNENGKVEYILLSGKQVLNPVRADGQVHSVRFFIPPYNINRYILLQRTSEKGKSNTGELKKLCKGMPVCVSFKYRGLTVYGVQPIDKNFFDTKITKSMKEGLDITDPAKATKMLFAQLRSMRKGAIFSPENSILPGEYTPWAAIDWDKFESMKQVIQVPQGGK